LRDQVGHGFIALLQASMSSSPVTLAQIAKISGLSRSTVSYALRNDPLASQETRERVQKLAAEMGYKPNPLLAAWMAQRRGSRDNGGHEVIAYVTAFGRGERWRTSATHLRQFRGALERGRATGYKVEVFDTTPDQMSAKRLSDILTTRGIRGIIVAPLPAHHGTLELAWDKFAAVSIGYSLAEPLLHRVTVDHYHSMLMTMQKLRMAGARRIGFAFPEDNVLRVDGIWQSVYLLYQAGVPTKSRVPLFMPPAADWKSANFLAWFDKHKPDAIVCGQSSPRDWLVARPAVEAQHVRFAQVNFSGDGGADCGVDQYHELVGATALDMVAAQLQHNELGVPVNPRVIMTKGRWSDQLAAKGSAPTPAVIGL